LRGARTFDEFSTLVGLANLFPVEPIRDSARLYCRWAFESATLDLALRQSGFSLHDVVGRLVRPVNFVASVRLGDPPSLAPLHARLGVDPDLRFKLDPTISWDDNLIEGLAHLACIDVVDMKGCYRNTNVAMDVEAGLYRRVIHGLPEAWIEDPALEDSTVGLLERHRDRSAGTNRSTRSPTSSRCRGRPAMLNLKPSRFGSVQAVFDIYEYCAAHGIGAYSGGMFEQGPGRGQLQYLASLFHPDAPNDVAPAGHNLQSPSRDLPHSPLRRSHTRPASAGGHTTGAGPSESRSAKRLRSGRPRPRFRNPMNPMEVSRISSHGA
jgi:hypothetical protein